ncbi:MAG TPA: type II toxin-antitoxin system RelE/ParE family toxin [Terracidiphilus sp.]|nr:type II toxin-antitoxin system RelE/ParE family toxin [Terracidiphilus sp.]
MKLRWSKRAIRRLASIHDYVAKDSPEAAARVAAAIVEAALRLEEFPLMGRVGRIEGTRELVVSGLPYILPYRIVDDVIQIASVIHTSRKWPERL